MLKSAVSIVFQLYNEASYPNHIPSDIVPSAGPVLWKHLTTSLQLKTTTMNEARKTHFTSSEAMLTKSLFSYKLPTKLDPGIMVKLTNDRVRYVT